MWAKVAKELSVPWRAAEAMHWQLGEADMARRAGVVPFSLSGMRAAEAKADLARENSSSQGSWRRGLAQNSLSHNIVLHATKPQPPKCTSAESSQARIPTRKDNVPTRSEPAAQGQGESPSPSRLAPIRQQLDPSSDLSLPGIADLGLAWLATAQGQDQS